MNDPSLCDALAQLLTSLDANTPIEAWPVVSKVQTQTIEIRDTVHPKFITEMLTGMLRGIGTPHDANRIHKRTRDDVLWNGALKPWRRSPFWLFLRVALQTSLAVGGRDHKDYKSIMVFFMAHILQLALRDSASSETLFLIAAKIRRRTLKLALGEQQHGIQYATKVVDAAHQELNKRWHSVERSPDPLGLRKVWNTTRLCFHPDTQLSLLNLRPYIDRIRTRSDMPTAISGFRPTCPPRIDCDERHPHLDRLMTGSDYPTRLSLLDLDVWVQKCLDNWLSINLKLQTACPMLAELIQDYTRVATSIYAGNPEDTSLMLLITMELWVALDKCATHQHPLLGMYEPGFPLSLFDPLLLPKRAQMDRLSRIEQHIQRRRNTSRHRSSLIFQDTNKAESFAVQYFMQSPHHQELRREVEAAAMVKRAEKKDELARKTQEHRHLLQRYNTLDHEEVTRWNGYCYDSHHWPYSCQKCQLKGEADALTITVHEWPLPYIELEAKSTVVELDVPKAIAKWRDTTFNLLVDCFSPSRLDSFSSSNVYPLPEFDGLCNYVCGETSRLQLASEAKPYVVSHYRSKKIPQATEGKILLGASIMDPHGCWTRFRYSECQLMNRRAVFQHNLAGRSFSLDVLSILHQLPVEVRLEQWGIGSEYWPTDTLTDVAVVRAVRRIS